MVFQIRVTEKLTSPVSVRILLTTCSLVQPLIPVPSIFVIRSPGLKCECSAQPPGMIFEII